MGSFQCQISAGASAKVLEEKGLNYLLGRLLLATEERNWTDFSLRFHQKD